MVRTILYPNLDSTQYPQLDLFAHNNARMSETLRQRMAERLRALMDADPNLNTIKKVAKKSTTSYGTVQRILSASEHEPSIGNVELVAECFGLTLLEFLQCDTPTDQEKISDEAMRVARSYQKLDLSERLHFAKQIKRAEMEKSDGRQQSVARR